MSSFIATTYEYSANSITGIMAKFSYNKYNIYRFFRYKDDKEKEVASSAANEVLEVLKKDLILPEITNSKNKVKEEINMIPGATYKTSSSGLIRNIFLEGVCIAFRLNLVKTFKHKGLREYYFIRDFNSIEEAWNAAMTDMHKYRSTNKNPPYTKLSGYLVVNYKKYGGVCSDEVYNSVILKN